MCLLALQAWWRPQAVRAVPVDRHVMSGSQKAVECTAVLAVLPETL